MATTIEQLLAEALKSLPEKPPDTANQSAKKAYSEQVSRVVAESIAEELRKRGMKECRPAGPNVVGLSGAERRLAGGIGAKKVDVSWSTEESGLLLGVSIKSINFRDGKTKNFQKNLTNRRGDMLFEAVTLHRRFPYSVLAGLIFLDKDANTDGTKKRLSTFRNAHHRFKMFTGRTDPQGRDEQYELLVLLLIDANKFGPKLTAYEVGNHITPIALSDAFDQLVTLLVERNNDFYDAPDGIIRKL